MNNSKRNKIAELVNNLRCYSVELNLIELQIKKLLTNSKEKREIALSFEIIQAELLEITDMLQLKKAEL